MEEPGFRHRYPNSPPPSGSNRVYPDLNDFYPRTDDAPPPPGFRPQFQQQQQYRYRQEPSICDVIRRQLVFVIVGVLLFSVGVGVTFWNEGRSVKRAQSLKEGLDSVTSLKASPRDGRISVSSTLDGSLVHLTARLSVPVPVRDPHFSVEIHAAKLKRVVEMLQWVEHERRTEFQDENGETRIERSYDYIQEWRTDLVHSLGFATPGHNNPDRFPLENVVFEADRAFLGPFLLSPSMRSKMDWFAPLDLSRLHAHLFPIGASKLKDFVYFGDHARPAVGDFRVSFAVAGDGDPVNAELLSAVAKQDSSSLTEFISSNGDSIGLIYRGDRSPQDIFAAERKDNLVMQWALRVGGWFLIFLGVMAISDLVIRLFSGIPLLRDVVAMTTVSLALVFSGSVSLLVIAVGWIAFRPMVALALGALALVPYAAARCRR